MTPEKAGPARLLALNRNHWCIENSLHSVRDVTFDEDRCRIRKQAGARVMALLRHLASGLLRLAGAVNIAQELRACAHNFHRALRLLGLALSWLTRHASSTHGWELSPPSALASAPVPAEPAAQV